STGRGGEAAVIENVAAWLHSVVAVLRRVHYAFAGEAVQLAMIEDGLAVTENEIGISGDVAMAEVLTGRNARAVIAVAVFAGGEERVLRAEDTQVAEYGAVARD